MYKYYIVYFQFNCKVSKWKCMSRMKSHNLYNKLIDLQRRNSIHLIIMSRNVCFYDYLNIRIFKNVYCCHFSFMYQNLTVNHWLVLRWKLLKLRQSTLETRERVRKRPWIAISRRFCDISRSFFETQTKTYIAVSRGARVMGMLWGTLYKTFLYMS